MNKQAGLSLIELMVAVVISSLLILGVTQMFANSSQSDRMNSAVARVQESGRVALALIGEDARRAGYQGCSASSNTKTVNSVKFPDEAIATAANSVTFRYATLENTGVTFGGNKTCDDVALYYKSVTYDQCANGTSLCMNGTAILDNATITGVSFGVLSDPNIRWVSSASATPANLSLAHSLRVTLTINDAGNNLSRVYSSTYELRNRL